MSASQEMCTGAGARFAATRFAGDESIIHPVNLSCRGQLLRGRRRAGVRFAGTPHGPVGVRQRSLLIGQVVLDEVRGLPHPPQRHAPRQLAQEHLLGPGQAKQLAGPLGLSGGLAEHDPGLGVGQEPLSQALLLGAVLAGRLQVRQAVHDGNVGDPKGTGQFERGLQPTGGGQVAKHGPRLVQDDEALGRAAGKGALQPRQGAHHEQPQGRGSVEAGKVENNQARS